MQTKTCKVCGEIKSIDKFEHNRLTCVSCRVQQKKEQRHAKKETIQGNTGAIQNKQHIDNTEQVKETIHCNTEKHENNTETISDNTCILSLEQQEQLIKLLMHSNNETIINNIKTIPGNTKKQTFVLNVNLLDKLNKYCKENRLTQSMILNHILNEFLQNQKPIESAK